MIYKKLKTALLLGLLLTTPFSSFAGEGTNSGGGGGLVVVNGELKLVTEAGVQVKGEGAEPYILQEETMSAIDQVLGAMELNSEDFKNLKTRILGRANTFKKVNSIDPIFAAKIQSAYSSVSQESGFNIPAHLIILAAYSDNYTTYIFPAFEQLKPIQQAKVLFHERNYRDTYQHPSSDSKIMKAELKSILRIDTLLENLFNKVQSGQPADRIPLHMALGLKPLYHVIKNLEDRQRRPIALNQIAISSGYSAVNEYGAGTGIHIDSVKLLEISGGSYSVRSAVENMKINFDTERLDSKPCPPRTTSAKCYKILRREVETMVERICETNPQQKNQNNWWFHLNRVVKSVHLVNCATKRISNGKGWSTDFPY
jgi:hypothetical protein